MQKKSNKVQNIITLYINYKSKIYRGKLATVFIATKKYVKGEYNKVNKCIIKKAYKI